MQLGKALLCGGDVNLCLLGLVDRVAELAQLEVDLAANAAWRQLWGARSGGQPADWCRAINSSTRSADLPHERLAIVLGRPPGGGAPIKALQNLLRPVAPLEAECGGQTGWLKLEPIAKKLEGAVVELE